MPQQLFSAGHIQDHAGIDLTGHSKTDAGRKVRLDQAGDDVHAGALGGDNEMDAGRPCHLGNAANDSFHGFGRGHHQVGQLINEDDDVRQRLLLLCSHFLIVGGQIAYAGLRKTLVAVFHFLHGPG